MIQSIKLYKTYNIIVGQDGKFLYNGIKMNIKEVPIVRIDFEHYGDNEIKYIEDTRKIFKYSIVLLELKSDRLTGEDLEHIKAVSKECAIYVYADIYDSDIDNGLSLDDRETAVSIYDIIDSIGADGICLVDKSTKLNTVTAGILIEDISEQYMIDSEKVSICSSPLSCMGYACLTAVKARALMAEYSTVDDVPLPTANHEKSCCGCIQYMVIEHDTEMAPQKSSNGNKSETVKKVKKTGIKFGATRF